MKLATVALLLSMFLFARTGGVWAGPGTPLECWFDSKDAVPSVAEFQSRGACAFEREGRVFLARSALRKLYFPKKGLATIRVKGHGWYFVRRDGMTISAVPWDNGPDVFVEGRARYREAGKVGFINESGQVVVKAEYQHAFQFEKGYAVVCNGAEVVSDGEHSSLEGGSWGSIDKKGRLVYPVKYSQTEMDEMMERLREKR